MNDLNCVRKDCIEFGEALAISFRVSIGSCSADGHFHGYTSGLVMTEKPKVHWLPQRVRDWREERQLEKCIEEINARFRPRMAATRTEKQEHDVDQEWTNEIEDYQDSLGALKTKRLLKLANKWEVEIPADAWVSNRYENTRYIYAGAQVKLRRSIRDARRESVKWWVLLLTPIVSALTGLAGALIGLLGYLLKKP